MDLRKTCNLLFFLLFVLFCQSQQDTVDSVQSPKLFVKGFAKRDAVYVRWGVNDQWAWKYGNEYGYLVERATIFRDGRPLEKSEKVILTGGPIKPKPLSLWESLIQNNDMAAVAAQAIYGESFSVNDESENLFMKVVNESSELEQRFGFSMFAVDQDFIAAQYAGLGYVDRDVKPNERYLYNVQLAAPQELMQLDEAGVLMAPTQQPVLPKPYDFAGYFYNNAFVLIWEYDGLLDFYTAYDLEKSEDGKNFRKVNDAPITKLAITNSSGISYTDSIPEYNKKYWYRIRGKSLFDMMSPPSDTISVIAFKELLAAPQFGTNTIVSDKQVELRWDFPTDEAWKLVDFDILRASKAIGPYEIVGMELGKGEREFSYQGLDRINYFKVRANGIAGDYQDSSPTMVQPVDSIPPDKPLGLAGTVDTLGVVRLSWEPNTELDLKGYTVLRANRKNQEFTRLTKEELRETTFQDTINVKTFASKVYYRIIATDLRYNESIPSDTLVLERPNMIPPTSPVFKAYEIIGDSIQLHWIPSSSENLAKQVVYRKRVDASMETSWENVFETDDISTITFKDDSLEPNTTYRYTLTTTNQTGLESPPSSPLSITTPKQLLQPKIKGLYVEANRENKYIQLSWRYNEPDVFEIQIFRKEEETFLRYATLPPESKTFKDKRVILNTKYRYGIHAVFKNGELSEWVEVPIIY
ncbi:fibronectin type III domain-containing protein [Flagellimonas sp. S174]|uniref:fibronectin type III domain-containing protein n=1 Tax=Flagellimonas sp. S174 TaxID=3410790 RepID=UPI003BF56B98